MIWNYLGIDPDPPRNTQVLALFADGTVRCLIGSDPEMIAWSVRPTTNLIKARCQHVLRGLPELKLVSQIIDRADTHIELVVALSHYKDSELADFAELVRALYRKALNIKERA